MQPEDYQRQGQGIPSFATLGNEQAQSTVLNQQIKMPSGELVRFHETLVRFHGRICDQRDQLVGLNERLGTTHPPATDGASKPSQPPTRDGILPAIEGHCLLIAEALDQVQYQIERLKQL